MTNTATGTVQYDDGTWTVENGPSDLGYYRITRVGSFRHTAYVHKSELTFLPEAVDVLEVVAALYTVYLNQNDGDEVRAETLTRGALVTLGWNANRAYMAAQHVANANA